jgi:TRAP-type C4-dicarboxylate transport system permease small subunit
MADSAETGPAAPLPQGLLDRLVAALAVAGGLLALGVACLVTVSVLRRWQGSQPIPGDFEFVQMATAVAVFAFLPYCQLRRGNIAVDTFTSGLPPRLNAAIDAFWDLVYAAAIALLAWCLSNGAGDMYRNGTTTMVLGLVVWPALALCTALACVLAITSCVTACRRLAGRQP